MRDTKIEDFLLYVNIYNENLFDIAYYNLARKGQDTEGVF